MYFKFDAIMNDEDYINFNIFYQTMTPDGKRGIKRARIRLIIVSLLMCFIVFSLTQSSGATAYFFTVLLIYFIVFCLRKKQNAVNITKRSLKISRESGRQLYSQYTVMEFFDDYFVESVDGIRTEIMYSVVKSVKILNGRYLYIDINNTGFYILPFKAFSSNEECTAFIDFLRTKVQNVEFY